MERLEDLVGTAMRSALRPNGDLIILHDSPSARAQSEKPDIKMMNRSVTRHAMRGKRRWYRIDIPDRSQEITELTTALWKIGTDERDAWDKIVHHMR